MRFMKLLAGTSRNGNKTAGRMMQVMVTSHVKQAFVVLVDGAYWKLHYSCIVNQASQIDSALLCSFFVSVFF